MAKKDLKILRKTKKVEFQYKGEYYVYEFRSDSTSGFAFIWKNQEKIYGPFQGDQTDEGIRVHKAIHNKLNPKKK